MFFAKNIFIYVLMFILLKRRVTKRQLMQHRETGNRLMQLNIWKKLSKQLIVMKIQRCFLHLRKELNQNSDIKTLQYCIMIS